MRLLLPGPGRSLDTDEALEAVYAEHSTTSLRANFVVSLEGAIETDGRSRGLGGPADRQIFAILRGLADVILVGAGTVRTENYGPARLGPETVKRRLGRGQSPVPSIAVVTGAAELDPAGKLFSRDGGDGTRLPRPVVLTCLAAPEDRRDRLGEVAEVVVCGDGDVDHVAALDALHQRGLVKVLCEGGPSLTTALVDEGLVDEFCLTHAPVLAGPGRRTLSEGGEWAAPQQWTLTSLIEGGGMLFARYRRPG